jgi:hypothetical protein
MVKRLWLGIRRHPVRAVVALITSFTTLWGPLEPFLAFSNTQITRNNGWAILGYLLVSIAVAIISVWPKRSLSFRFANTTTYVNIEYGDLFSKTDNIVISANEYFDSEIGRPVSTASVHGAFIQNVLGGHRNIMDQEVSSQLQGQHIEYRTRPHGKHYRYEIGTTVTIDHNQKKFFLFAMSASDDQCKALSDPAMMMTGLNGLWNKVRIEGGGHPVHIPLVGNGRSGVGLPPTQLLELILISILKSVKEKDLSTTINIVLQEGVFNEIDLDLVKYNWK